MTFMIKITLDRSLDRLGISMRKFSILSGVRPNTILELKNGEAKMIKFEMIDRILNGLNDISAERQLELEFTITDIISYEYQKH